MAPSPNVIVIIPSYMPSETLIGWLQELREYIQCEIIVVDDGNPQIKQNIYGKIMDMEGVTILRHPVNYGKGVALKTAFQYILKNRHDCIGVVTADSDGQHLPQDVGKVVKAFTQYPNTLFLGTRKMERDVPWRSRVGNIVTKKIFGILTSLKLTDTQTGLRGIPANILEELIGLNGQRFEYEMQMLLRASQLKLDIQELPIASIYIENNSSSNFRPLIDSLLIYQVLLSYIWTVLFRKVGAQFS